MNNLKKYYWVIALILLLPIVLNFILLIPRITPIVGNDELWLTFWVTYISAIVSFAMVYITWRTLKQNKTQLNELKRQWEEKQRARLSFSIIPSESWYVLKISNIGNETAFNIEISFNDNFIKNITIPNAQKMITKFQEHSFSIEAGRSKYLLFSLCEGAYDYWKEKCENIIVKGVYSEKYKIDEVINIPEYTIGGCVINDELTTAFKYFKKGVIVQNDSYYPIQRSLDVIAKKIEKINLDK